MESNHYQPWLHRIAVLTTVTALLPIGMGALVTTIDAGMAFPDWPTSDGHNMLLYPWLKSAGDQFAEHGHRLAGMLIGLVSIALVACLAKFETRRWVVWLGVAVLASVVAQGVLGGARVLRDERLLALIHGNFAAWVFALMASIALFTSKSWSTVNANGMKSDVNRLRAVAVMMPIVILVQYLLGGMVRHFGTALHEHLGFAALVPIFSVMVAAGAHRSGIGWLRRPAWCLLGLVLLQVALGAGAWVTKFGFAPVGFVAVQHSVLQISIRTAHTVVGMLVFMTSVLYALRVFRLAALSRGPSRRASSSPTLPPNSLSIPGGAG